MDSTGHQVTLLFSGQAVSHVNGITGNAFITGTNGITVSTSGQTITINGSGVSSGITHPTITTNHAISIWSGTAGQGLLNTPVTIDPTNGNIATTGQIFLNAPVTADILAGGNINIMSTGSGMAVGLTSFGAAGILALARIFLVSSSGISTQGEMTPTASGNDNLGSPALPYGNLFLGSGNYINLVSSGNVSWKVGVRNDGSLYSF